MEQSPLMTQLDVLSNEKQDLEDTINRLASSFCDKYKGTSIWAATPSDDCYDHIKGGTVQLFADINLDDLQILKLLA